MSANDFFTRQFQEAPAPGLPKGDRARRKLVDAAEAVMRDIQLYGGITYETVELTRSALAAERTNNQNRG